MKSSTLKFALWQWGLIKGVKLKLMQIFPCIQSYRIINLLKILFAANKYSKKFWGPWVTSLTRENFLAINKLEQSWNLLNYHLSLKKLGYVPLLDQNSISFFLGFSGSGQRRFLNVLNIFLILSLLFPHGNGHGLSFE